MPRWPVLLSVLALCGALGGRAHAGAYDDRLDQFLATQPPGTPPSAFMLIDGTYKGEALPQSGVPPLCPGGARGTISLGDRRLIYPYLPDTILVAPVGRDGSLRARAGNAVLEGHVGGGWLEFTVRTPTCESSYRLRWTM